MGSLFKAMKLIEHPSKWMYKLVSHFPQLIRDDRRFIEYIWKHRMNYPLNLDKPQTYNEKLQWLKLYDRNPIYTKLVDKFECKAIIASKIGGGYIIPTLGVWDWAEDIEWDKLPNQFVLKCTHDSGGLVICRDKSKLDKNAAERKLKAALKRTYWMAAREWPYKDVPHRILAEQYMEDEKTGELRDYKFFCFDGEVRCMFVASERQRNKEPYFDFFDTEFNNLGIKQGHPNSPVPIAKPKCFDEMKQIAAKLSVGIPQVRVDLYEVNGKVYFGEMTLFHHTGLVPFEPSHWDITFGDWIKLPNFENNEQTK